MDRFIDSDDDVVVTKKGGQIMIQARIKRKPKSWFGRDRDIIQIHGDIGAPIEIEWEAETGEDQDSQP